MKKIILVSSSPRRQDLLNQIKIKHEIFIPYVSEDNNENLSPENYVKDISYKKANYGKDNIYYNECVIIAADTIVVYNEEILGKPKDNSDAFRTLKKLSGKKHSVLTGLTVMDIGHNYYEESIVDETIVKMRNYSDEEINKYIETKEPFEKAGSYGIQGIGALLVERIEGDFNNVVGLPIVKLYTVLRKLEIL